MPDDIPITPRWPKSPEGWIGLATLAVGTLGALWAKQYELASALFGNMLMMLNIARQVEKSAKNAEASVKIANQSSIDIAVVKDGIEDLKNRPGPA